MLKKVLVLGGNGMLGGEAVYKMIQLGLDVTILNRGTWYWDSAERIKPHVGHIRCNRAGNLAESCHELAENKVFYDVVVDFSSYYPEDLQAILDVVKGRFKRYIYISSDSVYEVCLQNYHGGYNRETDAVRPKHPEKRLKYAAKDSYGDRKLACEEVLESNQEAFGYQYVSLRLPDVLGPRDNTGRWWTLILWLRTHRDITGPLHIPPYIENQPISLVYSVDVAKLIIRLMGIDGEVLNTSYNVAFAETLTLEELLDALAKRLSISKVDYVKGDNATVNFGIPSVSKGPIDVAKAMEALNWKPTSLERALNDSCDFYESAMRKRSFKNEMEQSLRRLGINQHSFAAFKELYYKLYGHSYDDVGTEHQEL